MRGAVSGLLFIVRKACSLLRRVLLSPGTVVRVCVSPWFSPSKRRDKDVEKSAVLFQLANALIVEEKSADVDVVAKAKKERERLEAKVKEIIETEAPQLP